MAPSSSSSLKPAAVVTCFFLVAQCLLIPTTTAARSTLAESEPTAADKNYTSESEPGPTFEKVVDKAIDDIVADLDSTGEPFTIFVPNGAPFDMPLAIATLVIRGVKVSTMKGKKPPVALLTRGVSKFFVDTACAGVDILRNF